MSGWVGEEGVGELVGGEEGRKGLVIYRKEQECQFP